MYLQIDTLLSEHPLEQLLACLVVAFNLLLLPVGN